jgi:type I restriction enzyme S subunit
MEVKRGYKQTDVGPLPDDWDVVSLGSCLELLTDFEANGSFADVANNVRVFDREEFAWYVRGTDLENNSRMSAVRYVDQRSYAFLRKTILRGGEVLITKRGEIGKVYLFEMRSPYATLAPNLYLLKLNSRALPQFVYFYFRYGRGNRTLKSINASTTIGALYKNDVKALQLPLPPTGREQGAIAEALRDADALIESLEQLLAKKSQIKQGAMQALLSPKADWSVEKLENIADVIDPHPSHRAPPEVPNGIPFLGIGDLSEGGDIIGTKLRRVDHSVFEEHRARYDLSEELIGLGRVASIGKVVKLRPAGAKYAVSPTLGVIRGTKVRRSYLLYALKSQAIVDQFTRIMSGSTRSSVGMVVLRKLDVGLPATDAEQTTIGGILADMDADIVATEAKLAKARQLKQGMMQELLTGRIRLV